MSKKEQFITFVAFGPGGNSRWCKEVTKRNEEHLQEINDWLKDGWKVVRMLRAQDTVSWVVLERTIGTEEDRLSDETIKEGFRWAIDALEPEPERRESLREELSRLLEDDGEDES